MTAPRGGEAALPPPMNGAGSGALPEAGGGGAQPPAAKPGLKSGGPGSARSLNSSVSSRSLLSMSYGDLSRCGEVGRGGRGLLPRAGRRAGTPPPPGGWAHATRAAH